MESGKLRQRGEPRGSLIGILFEKHLAIGYHMLHIFSKEVWF